MEDKNTEIHVKLSNDILNINENKVDINWDICGDLRKNTKPDLYA